eukprot:GHVP01030616.1.p1 GENE.GHVP01030616.1~~GHVP01030616.1.p1  ORF type:complete len:494 (-),score=99.83 GHVP01030616.1:1367-2848(-)
MDSVPTDSEIRKAAEQITFVEGKLLSNILDKSDLVINLYQKTPEVSFLESFKPFNLPSAPGKKTVLRKDNNCVVLAHVPSDTFNYRPTLQTVANFVKDFVEAQEGKATVIKIILNQCVIESVSICFLKHVLMTLYPDRRFKKDTTHPEKNLKISVHKTSEGIKQPYFSTLFFACQTCRELTNSPPNYCTTETLAKRAREIAALYNLECKILGEKECRDLNMGAYLAVNQGSMYQPQFIHLTYKPENSPAKKRFAFIGKGICYDSGGYNLKQSLLDIMKIDMGGSAVVLSTAEAIGKLKPQSVEIHFIVPAAENMISHTAYRTSDVVTASNGMTVEVGNTDAEGRLTLADALVYTESTVKPDKILEISTLTGACAIALGTDVMAVYSADNAFAEDVKEASVRGGDQAWIMPLVRSYKKNIDSKIADLNNTASTRYGGSINAALFLNEFVETTPFIHIDMGLSCFDTTSFDSSGHGVQMMVEFFLKEEQKCSNNV